MRKSLFLTSLATPRVWEGERVLTKEEAAFLLVAGRVRVSSGKGFLSSFFQSLGYFVPFLRCSAPSQLLPLKHSIVHVVALQYTLDCNQVHQDGRDTCYFTQKVQSPELVGTGEGGIKGHRQM